MSPPTRTFSHPIPPLQVMAGHHTKPHACPTASMHWLILRMVGMFQWDTQCVLTSPDSTVSTSLFSVSASSLLPHKDYYYFLDSTCVC